MSRVARAAQGGPLSTNPLEELTHVLSTAPREDLPELLGELERLKAAAWLRLAVPPAPEPGDKLLTAEEAAEKLGFLDAEGKPDPSPLYRKRWPFRVEVSKGRTRYSRAGIEAFIRTRRGR